MHAGALLPAGVGRGVQLTFILLIISFSLEMNSKSYFEAQM